MKAVGARQQEGAGDVGCGPAAKQRVPCAPRVKAGWSVRVLHWGTKEKEDLYSNRYSARESIERSLSGALWCLPRWRPRGATCCVVCRGQGHRSTRRSAAPDIQASVISVNSARSLVCARRVRSSSVALSKALRSTRR